MRFLRLPRQLEQCWGCWDCWVAILTPQVQLWLTGSLTGTGLQPDMKLECRETKYRHRQSGRVSCSLWWREGGLSCEQHYDNLALQHLPRLPCGDFFIMSYISSISRYLIILKLSLRNSNPNRWNSNCIYRKHLLYSDSFIILKHLCDNMIV